MQLDKLPQVRASSANTQQIQVPMQQNLSQIPKVQSKKNQNQASKKQVIQIHQTITLLFKLLLNELLQIQKISYNNYKSLFEQMQQKIQQIYDQNENILVQNQTVLQLVSYDKLKQFETKRLRISEYTILYDIHEFLQNSNLSLSKSITRLQSASFIDISSIHVVNRVVQADQDSEFSESNADNNILATPFYIELNHVQYYPFTCKEQPGVFRLQDNSAQLSTYYPNDIVCYLTMDIIGSLKTINSDKIAVNMISTLPECQFLQADCLAGTRDLSQIIDFKNNLNKNQLILSFSGIFCYNKLIQLDQNPFSLLNNLINNALVFQKQSDCFKKQLFDSFRKQVLQCVNNNDFTQQFVFAQVSSSYFSSSESSSSSVQNQAQQFDINEQVEETLADLNCDYEIDGSMVNLLYDMEIFKSNYIKLLTSLQSFINQDDEIVVKSFVGEEIKKVCIKTLVEIGVKQVSAE